MVARGCEEKMNRQSSEAFGENKNTLCGDIVEGACQSKLVQTHKY